MISVSIIAKNETSCIAACLESVKDADEIVVCDTGSDDDTIEIARRYTDRVYSDYTWEDDFAKARNHALSKCKGDWVLSIDCDETLEPGGMDKIREVIKSNKRMYSASMRAGNQRHSLPRVCRNDGSVWWEGEAHEVLVPTVENPTDIVINYGRSKAHSKDPGRMMRILTKAVKDSPKNARNRFYLAREYFYKGDYVTALWWYREYLSIAKWKPEMADAQLMIARCYWFLQKGEKAREECLRAIYINPDYGEALRFMAVMHYEPMRSKWLQFAELAKNKGVIFLRERIDKSGISIIVPAYKAQEFIGETLESFAKQTNTYKVPIEILVGVDGCPDTLEALRGSPARVFNFPENHGMYTVVNSLVPKASHPYLMIFGADDVAFPDMIDQIVEHRTGVDILRQVTDNNLLSHGAIGIWREAFERMGGYEPWRCAADYEFNVRAERVGLTTKGLPKATFHYRLHPEQLTKAKGTAMGSDLREGYHEQVRTSTRTKIKPVTAYFTHAEKRTATLATVPGREAALRECLESLCPQMDAVYVAFNYPAGRVPGWFRDLQGHHNNLWDGMSCATNLGSCEKFAHSAKGEGWQFICDDDLIYPPDYAEYMIAKAEQYKRKAIINCGGSVIKEPLVSFYNGRKDIKLVLQSVPEDSFVNYPTTGAMLFHSDLVRFPMSIFRAKNMDGLFAAMHCQEKKIPMVAAAHPAGWLKYSKHMKDKPTIWDSRKEHDRDRARFINEIEWSVYEL
jgi:glycosyltransferase involved in cell wall biosynthesis